MRGRADQVLVVGAENNGEKGEQLWQDVKKSMMVLFILKVKCL